jgi:hypothetical protein
MTDLRFKQNLNLNYSTGASEKAVNTSAKIHAIRKKDVDKQIEIKTRTRTDSNEDNSDEAYQPINGRPSRRCKRQAIQKTKQIY